MVASPGGGAVARLCSCGRAEPRAGRSASRCTCRRATTARSCAQSTRSATRRPRRRGATSSASACRADRRPPEPRLPAVARDRVQGAQARPERLHPELRPGLLLAVRAPVVRVRLAVGVFAAAGAFVLLELLLSSRYGHSRDELYFL